MTALEWVAAGVGYYVLVFAGICRWLDGPRRAARDVERPWFDHDRFAGSPRQQRALLDRVRTYTHAVGVIEHPCSYGGEILEYPVAAGWDEDSILATLAEIEAL